LDDKSNWLENQLNGYNPSVTLSLSNLDHTAPESLLLVETRILEPNFHVIPSWEFISLLWDGYGPHYVNSNCLIYFPRASSSLSSYPPFP